MHRSLEELCNQLHVEFVEADERVGDLIPREMRIGDRMHMNAAAAAIDARAETKWLLDAWKRHTADTQSVAAKL